MDDNTVQMDEKDIAYAKAIATIDSCQTREQLDNARTYVRQYIEKYSEGPECGVLWRMIKDVDRRLFPESQRPLEEKG